MSQAGIHLDRSTLLARYHQDDPLMKTFNLALALVRSTLSRRTVRTMVGSFNRSAIHAE